MTKQALINWTITRPRQPIALALVLSLVLASGVRFIHIEDDIMKMLPGDLPSRQVWDQIEEQFGSTEPLLVTIGRKGESIYQREFMAAVWDLTRVLERLPIVDEVQSLTTMNRLENVDGFLEVGQLVPARDLPPEEIGEIKAYIDANPDVGGMLVSPSREYTMLAVVPVAGTSDADLAAAVLEAEAGLDHGYQSHISGMPFIRGVLAEVVRGDVLGLMRIGMIVLALILLVNLRSPAGLMMVMAVIVLSTAAMIGFFGWLYHFTRNEWFNFTMLNTTMPVILLTIATADGVHIMTRFFREVRKRRQIKASIAATMDVLMMPVFLTSITTIAGFISLTTAPLKAMVGFGLAVSFGIAWAWFLSITLLPGLMASKSWKLEARALKTAGWMEIFIQALGRFVLLKPRAVIAVSMTIILLSLAGITLVKVEVNIAKFFKPSSPILQSLEFMDDNFHGSATFAIKVQGDLKAPGTLQTLERIQRVLEKERNVGQTTSIANVITKLHRIVMDDSAAYEVIPDSRAKVANLLTLYSMAGDPNDFSRLVDYDYQTGIITATFRMSSTEKLVAMVDRIEETLADMDLGGNKVWFSGLPVFMRDFIHVLVSSSVRSLVIALILVVALSGFFLGSLRWGLLAVVPLASAIALNFGLMGWLGIALNQATALLTSIIIGVGVDFAVHFVAQAQAFLRSGTPRDQVSKAAINDVGYPILLNVMAVSVGFAALLFSDFVPINYMGGLVIISMVSCAVGTLTLLAASIHLMRQKITA